MTHGDTECKVEQQVNNGSANIAVSSTRANTPTLSAFNIRASKPPLRKTQPPCQHINAVNVQQQCQHTNFAKVSHPCLFSNNDRQQSQSVSSTAATWAARGLKREFSYTATTTVADDIVPTIYSNETSDKARETKSLAMLGRDHRQGFNSTGRIVRKTDRLLGLDGRNSIIQKQQAGHRQ